MVVDGFHDLGTVPAVARPARAKQTSPLHAARRLKKCYYHVWVAAWQKAAAADEAAPEGSAAADDPAATMAAALASGELQPHWAPQCPASFERDADMPGWRVQARAAARAALAHPPIVRPPPPQQSHSLPLPEPARRS